MYTLSFYFISNLKITPIYYVYRAKKEIFILFYGYAIFIVCNE
jgi:hypothetical protein